MDKFLAFAIAFDASFFVFVIVFSLLFSFVDFWRAGAFRPRPPLTPSSQESRINEQAHHQSP